MLKTIVMSLGLVFTSFGNAAYAADWRVEALAKIDIVIAKAELSRKADCVLQTDKSIYDTCNRYWDLIEGHLQSLRPDLEFMIALDKIDGHAALKASLSPAMSKEAYSKEVDKIVAYIHRAGEIFTVDQAKLAENK